MRIPASEGESHIQLAFLAKARRGSMWLNGSCALQMGIRRESHQAMILYRPAHGEVIQVLKLITGETQQIVKRVVEVAADACRAHASSLGFQIQHLAENPRFPEQTALPPSALGADRLSEISDHSQAEGAIRGDLLVTTDNLGRALQVPLHQAIQPQMLRASRRPFPPKRHPQGGPQPIVNRLVPFQQIQSGSQASDTLNENSRVNLRRPGKRIPGRHPWARQQVIEHSVKSVGGNGGLAVESQAAALWHLVLKGCLIHRERPR